MIGFEARTFVSTLSFPLVGPLESGMLFFLRKLIGIALRFAICYFFAICDLQLAIFSQFAIWEFSHFKLCAQIAIFLQFVNFYNSQYARNLQLLRNSRFVTFSILGFARNLRKIANCSQIAKNKKSQIANCEKMRAEIIDCICAMIANFRIRNRILRPSCVGGRLRAQNRFWARRAQNWARRVQNT